MRRKPGRCDRQGQDPPPSPSRSTSAAMGRCRSTYPSRDLPVKEGPPAPPAPDARPLHPQRGGPPGQARRAPRPARLRQPRPDAGAGREAGQEAVQRGPPSEPAASPAERQRRQQDAARRRGTEGMFGDLTLRRVKATGHAVWLQQPAEGTKIRCNELIHEVAPPGGQNMTYFRGDATRKLWVEKFDFVEERPGGPDGPVARKVQSVTHVWTMDATIFDDGATWTSQPLSPAAPACWRPGPVPSEADTPEPGRAARSDRDLARSARPQERARAPTRRSPAEDPDPQGPAPDRRSAAGLVARRGRYDRRLAQAQAGRERQARHGAAPAAPEPRHRKARSRRAATSRSSDCSPSATPTLSPPPRT